MNTYILRDMGKWACAKTNSLVLASRLDSALAGGYTFSLKKFFSSALYLALSQALFRMWQFLAQVACVRHACLRAPCVAWPLLSPTFALSLFLRLLLLTHFGESPMCEIIFHPIFWHNQKIYAKKIWVNFIFSRIKCVFFSAVFLLFMASVRSRPTGPPAVPGVFVSFLFKFCKVW